MDSVASDVRISGRALALLALLALLPYLNAMADGFTLDDEPSIRNNPAVTRGIDLLGILSSPLPPLNTVYRPLTVLTYALNEAVAPANAPLFHAVNVILHTGVTVLAFWIALWLFESQRLAMIAAALFAIHPIHTEAVTSIVGRAELLVAFFGLIALLAGAGSDRAASRWSRLVLELLSVTSYALALLCKENAVTLLPLIALFRIVCRKEPLLRGLVTELRTLTWLPYALCTGLFILCRAYLTGAVTYGINVTPLDNALAFVPWEARVRSALGVLWDYFGLLNVPMVLSADYSYNQVAIVESWLNPRCLAGLLLLAAATMGVLCAQRGAMRFTVALPLVALLPTANLLFPIGTVKAERLLYLPSMGWILLVALGFDRLLGTPRYRSIATLALVAVALTFSARTWLRNGDWRDNATLFESTAYSAPRSAKARYNFGIALQDRGALDAAVGEYEQALAIASWTEGAAFGLGVNSEKRGRTAQAIQWYRRALEIAPDYDDAHTNLCHVLYDSGQFAAAASACRSGLRYKPADANLLKGLGASLVALGETDKGLELLRRSLALNTRDHELQVYVARLERTPAGSRTEAIGVE